MPKDKEPSFIHLLFQNLAVGAVGILFAYVVAQAGGLRIVPTGADAYDVRLFGKLAWTGTGNPRADYGGAIMAFIVVGWLTAMVTRWTLMWYFGRDDAHEPA